MVPHAARIPAMRAGYVPSDVDRCHEGWERECVRLGLPTLRGQNRLPFSPLNRTTIALLGSPPGRRSECLTATVRGPGGGYLLAAGILLVPCSKVLVARPPYAPRLAPCRPRITAAHAASIRWVAIERMLCGEIEQANTAFDADAGRGRMDRR